MMFGSLKCCQSTSGMKTSGCATGSATEACMSLSMVRCNARSQCTHFVSTVTETYSWRKCPCTKGTAIASSAQAA
jgi:hypothetical protein